MNVPRDSKSYERFVKAAGHNFVHLSNLERPGSGSKWNLTDILTFRVLYNRHEDDFPPILKPLRSVADKRLKSKAFRAIVGLVEKQVWKGTPHDELQRIGKDFGSFLSYLAEALETPWTIKEVEVSARPRRDIPQAEYKQESDDEEDLFDFEASADDQEEVIAESSDDSDRSHEDQDTLDRQNKSETVTSALIMEFLKSLAKCTRNSDDRKFRLEWTTDQDTFEFEVPTRAGLVSKNDGGLVHRSLDPYGNWARMTPLSCYCSIEASIWTHIPSVLLAKHVLQAKAAHFANGKRIVVYAQEVSQIIGMIHQREENSRNSGSGTHLAKK